MKYDISALGELLIDFTPYGNAEDGAKLFGRNAGGAPANLLAAISKFGGKCYFFTKVGRDMFGEFLIETMRSSGVETDGIAIDDVHNTTLAFVSLDESGDRDFSFYRRFGADAHLSIDDINEDIIRASKFFHFGSLSLTNEPMISATEKALNAAKNAGCIITYDPNYRPLLWDSEAHAVRAMKEYMAYADIVKVAYEEALLISGCDDIEEAAMSLLKIGMRILLITDGGNGVRYYSKSGSGFLPTIKANVVDTTGAGDIFFGTFIYGLIKDRIEKDALDSTSIEKYVKTAILLSGKSTEKKGGIASIPEYMEA